MATLANRAKVTTATTGTGTITLGSAVSGFQTFAAAGVSNGATVSYVIEEGTEWEVGTGTYSSTGPTLTRTPSESSNAGAAINLAGAAQVYITAIASDLQNAADMNQGVATTDSPTFAGGTMTGDLAFGDNVFAVFNSSGSFAISSDATVGSFIFDSTPQGITAQTDTFFLSSSSVAGIMLSAQQGGAVDLYHNNALRLSTTALGTTINGDLTANGAGFLSNIDVTGNITLTGTVDGRDVAADGTKLDGIEAGADVTDTANVTAAGALMTTGGTLTGNVSFGDNDKAIFGAGSDLEIYHDGSNSFINDAGSGILALQGSTSIGLYEYGTFDRMLTATGGGAVNLYYDDALKLATTSTGVSVTGNVTVSGTVDGRDVATDGAKLDGIEAGATADQTASEILTAIKTVDGSGSGLDADLVDGLNASSFIRSDANDTGIGNYSTSGNFWEVGAGSGGVAMTINDGGGNANLTFNHRARVPDQTGNAARIEVNVDSTTNGRMFFEVGTNKTSGVATNLTPVMTLSETAITAESGVTFTGDGSGLTGIQAGAGYFQGENGNTGDTTNGKGDIFRTHESTLNTNVTIASGDNSLAAGPLTVASGVTLTVSGNLSIV